MTTKKKASKPAATATSQKSTLLPTDPSLTPAEAAAVQAVQEFNTAEKVVALFEQENERVMAEYRALLDEREQKRQEADKLVRGLDVSCGPWKRYTETIRYDESALFQIVGKAKFLEIGGVIGTTSTYSIESSRIELAISTGTIPPATVNEFKKVTPMYRAPKPK
jgi:hypothetical protein